MKVGRKEGTIATDHATRGVVPRSLPQIGNTGSATREHGTRSSLYGCRRTLAGMPHRFEAVKGIDQVNRLVLDIFPQDLKIVAVVKGVHERRARNTDILFDFEEM
jgi:hypothetical protein